MSEFHIQHNILQTLRFYHDVTLWRANVGTHGFHVSLPKGFPDLFGYKSFIITPDMVGNQFAQFAFIEVKQPGGRISKVQLDFHHKLISDGAIGGVSFNVSDALNLLRLQ